MDSTKLSAVCDWVPLKLVKAVWSFIGFCNFYQKFIPNFSTLAQTLHNLTKKGVQFHWTKEQDDTFIKLKEIFLSALVIQIPNISKPFHVMTDASLTALGGVLMQTNANGDLHPYAYYSQKFSSAEHNYDIYDKELLAVLHALKEWRNYLTDTIHLVTIIPNHENLGYSIPNNHEISLDSKHVGCYSYKIMIWSGGWNGEWTWNQPMPYHEKMTSTQMMTTTWSPSYQKMISTTTKSGS